MNLQQIRWFIILIFLIGVPACASTQSTVPGEDANVLFSDDFTASSNWAFFDTQDGAAYIQQAELYLADFGSSKSISTSLLGREWDNVIIRTQLRQAAGTQNNWMGLTCRQADESNYYLFAISADGYYLVLKVVQGKTMQLAGPDTSSAINPGKGINTLEAHCVEENLRLRINQQEVASLTDESFSSGKISLFADSVTQEETSVAFDNFVISAP